MDEILSHFVEKLDTVYSHIVDQDRNGNPFGLSDNWGEKSFLAGLGKVGLDTDNFRSRVPFLNILLGLLQLF